MAETKTWRLQQVASKINVGLKTIVETLAKKGHKVDPNPNSKLTEEHVKILEKEFEKSIALKQEADEVNIGKSQNLVVESSKVTKLEDEDEEERVLIKQTAIEPVVKQPINTQTEEKKNESGSTNVGGLNVVGKIDLSKFEKKKTPVQKEENTQKNTSDQKQFNKPENKDFQKKNHQGSDNKQNYSQGNTHNQQRNNDFRKDGSQQDKNTNYQDRNKFNNNQSNPQNRDNTSNRDNNSSNNRNQQGNNFQNRNDRPENRNFNRNNNQGNNNQGNNNQNFNKDRNQHFDKPKEFVAKDVEKTPVVPIDPELLDESVISSKADKLQGLKVVGKIDLKSSKPNKAKQVASSDDAKKDKKRKRKRLKSKNEDGSDGAPKPLPKDNENKSKVITVTQDTGLDKKRVKKKAKKTGKDEVSDKEISVQLKATLAKMSSGKLSTLVNRGKYRTKKKLAQAEANELKRQEELESANILRVTEFISANELANLMGVTVTEVIAKFMVIGMFVSINQRLDAESIRLIADEFGFDVEFTTTEEDSSSEVEEEEDDPDDLKERAPIVTIMGHVDHGKTSLLDYIRKTKVAAGEAGGITQHIGAYDVKTSSGKRIVFLDTPGHEAFTAMRARGAKVTDIAIIVIAADDSIMPQTDEAINHANLAGVPIIFAINKVDKAEANPEKIKEQLAQRNFLVEDWGGKYQSQEISAKKGTGVEDLLEKILLEAEMLELKANPKKRAVGTVIEASLDKGKGFVATVLIQTGFMKAGAPVLAGQYFGRVKAMTDHRGAKINQVGPSTPVQVLGLNGAPQAGDKFYVMESEKDAREIATKRSQILREQTIRATKRTTLSDIGRRIALGNFQQLNLIVKGDVDGSIEALCDSLLKLSTEEIEVNIIHKAVGQISESDVLLASASDAIIIGFQVRPSVSSRKLAEKEQIEIRLYSIIYDAINEVRSAMEGMLKPKIEEVIIGNVQVREVYKISKVGTVAGCMVTDGHVTRQAKVRVIRDGIVVFGGEEGASVLALKRFKDDVSEVKQGYECGMSIKNFSDLRIDDIIEAYEEKEVKRTLK